ncbi:tripartite motif-containing protein 16-like [Gymnodraco acuticeps]|uniref:Tripartite motif-containing protein 16-like n=1 Tax=Gymnodraco acuticeps TaxID=8218 RepID=A0A6P8TR75_GYMAC|nr:tripartite motif-containing protein 16-like [Gymnodraco acuticeps]
MLPPSSLQEIFEEMVRKQGRKITCDPKHILYREFELLLKDREEQKKIYSCPHCIKTFKPRPALVKKNFILADLVDELKQKKMTQPQVGPSDPREAGPGDVGCDVCTGRKRKAQMSCLQCLVSFCEQHLQPHYEVPYKKHKLIEALKLQENICSQHHKVMDIFCRTDKKVICILCLNDEHKEHNIVSAAAEMSKKKKKLGVSRQNIQQRIQNKEKHVKQFQQEVDAINLSAYEAVWDSELTCTELVNLIEQRSSEVTQQIMSRQEYEVSRVKEIQETLQKDISDLKRKYTKLEKLSQTDDQIKFLQAYPSLSNLRDPEKPFRVNKDPVRYFEDVTAAVSEARGKVLERFNKEWMKISETVTEVDVKLLPDPKTKADFSQYAAPKYLLKLDPNTASMQIQLSEDNRKATSVTEPQSYDDHKERFMARSQVLCGEGLTNHYYWEVEWSGMGGSVAVAYKDVPRRDGESVFGDNDTSWTLEFSKTICNFKHNHIKKKIPILQSSRIGVFLDQKAGVLSFHSVSETITLLHRVQTTFTQPLYAGLGVYYNEASATFCDIKVEQLSSEPGPGPPPSAQQQPGPRPSAQQQPGPGPHPAAQQQPGPGPHPAAQQQPDCRPASKDLPLPDDQQPSTPEDDSPSLSGEVILIIDIDEESEYSSESESGSPSSDSSPVSLTAGQRVSTPLHSLSESNSGSFSTPEYPDPPSEAQGEAPFEVSTKKRHASRNLNQNEKRANVNTSP